MLRYFVTYDKNGTPRKLTKIDAQRVPPQKGQEVTQEEFLAAQAQAAQAQEPPRPTLEQEIDRAIKSKGPEATLFEWVREKLGIDEETAKHELKQLHKQRKEKKIVE